MIIAALIVLGIVALAAIALAIFVIRELRTNTTEIVTAAFDRLQAKSLGEVAATENARAMNSVAVKNLQDALAAKPQSPTTPPATKRKLHGINGEEYNEEDLETY